MEGGERERLPDGLKAREALLASTDRQPDIREDVYEESYDVDGHSPPCANRWYWAGPEDVYGDSYDVDSAYDGDDHVDEVHLDDSLEPSRESLLERIERIGKDRPGTIAILGLVVPLLATVLTILFT